MIAELAYNPIPGTIESLGNDVKIIKGKIIELKPIDMEARYDNL
jgi:hypothetical protein